MINLKARNLWLGALVFAGLGLLYVTGLDSTCTWWPDDAFQYLAHASNIAEGRPYSDTGYIFNPAAPRVGPQAYPPVYPLALAGALKVFGLNIKALKLYNIIFLFAFFALVFAAFRKKTGAAGALLLVLFTAVNPWFIQFRDCIYADWFTLPCIFGGLLLASGGLVGCRRAAAAALLCYFAYGSRPVFLVLVPVVLGYDLYVRRRFSREAGVFALVFACAAAVQNIAVPLTVVDYAGNFGSLNGRALDWNGFWEAAANVPLPFVNFFGFSYPFGGSLFSVFGAAAFLLGVLSVFLAGVHYRRRWLEHDFSVWDIFLPCYAATFMLVFDWERYFFPLAPIFLYQAASGLFVLLQGQSVPVRRTVFAVLAVLLLLNYGSGMAAALAKNYPPEQNIEHPAGTDLLRTVIRVTPPDSVIIFFKPRALAFFTGRRSASYACNSTPEANMAYFRSINARYLIYSPELDAVNCDTGLSILRENEKVFCPVYGNGVFWLFRIAGHGEACGG